LTLPHSTSGENRCDWVTGYIADEKKEVYFDKKIKGHKDLLNNQVNEDKAVRETKTMEISDDYKEFKCPFHLLSTPIDASKKVKRNWSLKGFGPQTRK
jgi:hypothetical protein